MYGPEAEADVGYALWIVLRHGPRDERYLWGLTHMRIRHGIFNRRWVELVDMPARVPVPWVAEDDEDWPALAVYLSLGYTSKECAEALGWSLRKVYKELERWRDEKPDWLARLISNQKVR